MIMDSFILTLVYYERIVNIVCTILIDKQAPWNPDAPAYMYADPWTEDSIMMALIALIIVL